MEKENEHTILELKDVHKRFKVRAAFSGGGGTVHAVSGVDLNIRKRDSFGIVGESGCGKTTLGKIAIRLIKPDEGTIFFNGTDITSMSEKFLRPIRKKMQIVFQDPFSSLNPRMNIESIIGEGMVVHGIAKKKDLRDSVASVLTRVGLQEDVMNRYPHEFSGGQRQRICIARAIALDPQLIVADEPLSALDVSIQAQILNLLMDIRDDMGVSYLFISHDLRVVNYLCNKVAVMYLGKIVERGPSELIFGDPRHPYTKALIASIPRTLSGKKGKKIVLEGDLPSPFSPPPGCSFHTRCPIAQDICSRVEPELRDVAGRKVSCHFA